MKGEDPKKGTRLFEKEELFNALMSQMGAVLYASYRADQGSNAS